MHTQWTMQVSSHRYEVIVAIEAPQISEKIVVRRWQQPIENLTDLQVQRTPNKTQEKHTNRKHDFNEVRPQCLRPRGNPLERLITTKMFTITISLFECKRDFANPFSQALFRSQTLKLNNSLKYPDLRSSRFSPKPDFGRPAGRPTSTSGRPVGRPNLTESLALTVRELRSTGRSTAYEPCACCACRSTGPVDRHAQHAQGS